MEKTQNENIEDTERKAFQEEYSRIRSAVASIVLDWSAIEGTLALMLGNIIADELEIARSIFFSPTGIK